MEEYALENYGMFDGSEIQAIVDSNGEHWFTQDLISSVLGLDRTTVIRVRKNHPSEFTEHVDWSSIVFNKKRRVVYSEEGFLTICDMSTTDVAYRLRRWMRKQFRVRRKGDALIVQARQMPAEDISDLSENLIVTKRLLDGIIANHRGIARLNQQAQQIEEDLTEQRSSLKEAERRLAQIEESARLKPGELTAIQLANHCGWLSNTAAPHNVAVILAAHNCRFVDRGLMVTRKEVTSAGMIVDVFVFTVDGVATFIQEVDSQYNLGQQFTITPNSHAKAQGQKCRRHVIKGRPLSVLTNPTP